MPQAVIEGHFDRIELVRLTAAQTNEPAETVSEIVKAAFKILALQVAQRGYATIHGFGSFRVDEIAARSGTDPQDNHYDAPERLTIEFNPEKAFRDQLAELTGKKVIA